MQINEKELQEAIAIMKDIIPNTMGLQAYQIEALAIIINLAQLHLKVMKSGIPKERFLFAGNVELNKGYNLAIDEFTVYLTQKLEGLENLIAEFIPHRDNNYIRPLATAIRKELGVE